MSKFTKNIEEITLISLRNRQNCFTDYPKNLEEIAATIAKQIDPTETEYALITIIKLFIMDVEKRLTYA